MKCQVNKKLNYIVEPEFKKILGMTFVNNKIYLTEDFEFCMYFFGTEQIIKVPANFKSDGFSLPLLFKPLHNPLGKGVEIAIVHDFLYSKLCPPYITRGEADLFFFEGMNCMRMSAWKSNLFYLAVRLFGWFKYKKK
jgi:hypothetical protein